MLEELKKRAQRAADELTEVVREMRSRMSRDEGKGREALEWLGKEVDKVEERLRAAGGGLVQKGQEAELQLHLGIMEARDRWDALKEDLSEITDRQEERARQARERFDHARLQAHLGRLEAAEMLAERRHRMKKRLDTAADTLREETSEVLEGLIHGLEKVRSSLRGKDR